MITAAKIIQNQKNILSERAKCTFCFVLIKQNLAQNVLRKGNNLFCRLYDEAGFNSTPILYSMFKKKTGMTPYEFKKTQESLG